MSLYTPYVIPPRDGYNTESPKFEGFMEFVAVGIVVALIVFMVWEYRIRKKK